MGNPADGGLGLIGEGMMKKQKVNYIQRAYNEGFCDGINHGLSVFDVYLKYIDGQQLAFIRTMIKAKDLK